MRTGRNDTNTLLKKVNTIDMFRPDAMNNLKKENADAFGLTAFKYIYFFFQNTKNYYLQVVIITGTGIPAGFGAGFGAGRRGYGYGYGYLNPLKTHTHDQNP